MTGTEGVVLLFLVAASLATTFRINQILAAEAAEKARQEGFLEGYRKCITARRTIINPPTTNQQHQS